MLLPKRTKIVCTLGPSSDTENVIRSMIRAGMNVARLNFSHGSHEHHAKMIATVRAVAEDLGEPVAILLDLQGPKIRVGELPEKGRDFVAGETVVFDTSLTKSTKELIALDFESLHEYVEPGQRLLLNDGRVETVIQSVNGTRITVKVSNSGNIISHKGINVPDTILGFRSLTEKDKEDAKFGIRQRVDFFALSFVTRPDDILDLRYLIEEYEKELNLKPEQPIRIIAKIERAEAIKAIDKILDVVDGIMVARGDLGIEIPAEEVPLAQKRLIDSALAFAKPVIVATQMLDSMQHSPRPTRAEVSDVANAVIDHTDAVMLSNETAVGDYPVETVQTMTNIIKEAERSTYAELLLDTSKHKNTNVDEVISMLSRLVAEDVDAKAILAASITGETARLISRNRPNFPIVVATNTEIVQRQLNLSHGILPFVLPTCRSVEELVERSMVYLKDKKLVKKGDLVVLVAGEPVGQAGHVNLLELKKVS